MGVIEREKWFTQRRRGARIFLHSQGLILTWFKAQFLLAVCMLLLAAISVYAERRHHIPAEWQQLTQDKAFSYKNDIEAVQPVKQYEPGAFQKIIAAIFNFFGSGAGNILLWIIVICAVLYILYKLFLSSDSFLFSRSKKIPGEPDKAPEDEEDLATTNWEILFHQAAGNNDMRLAIRYSYKWLLQLLQRNELIQYRNDKTNYEYYTELNDTDYKQPFKQLSRQYEYAWYGQYALPPTAYNDYLMLFNNVRKKLGA
jgi:hypothetical protein